MAYHIERLPNGFIRVYDRAAQWSHLFNADGSPRAVQGCAEYRHQLAQAVKAWLAR